MNQLKHILGITLPNGLALRGSSLSRSAGTNGRDPKRSKIISVRTNDREVSPEPKLSSRSYARLIADYSKSIETRTAAGKLNGESKMCRPKGFFLKTPFQRLARVSSLTNLKNVGINGGSGLCTKSSSRPIPDTISTTEKPRKIKSNLDDDEGLNQVSDRAVWLDHVVNAHNAKRLTKNYNITTDCCQPQNLVHQLVQRLPESRATINATTKNLDRTKISSVKNCWTTHQNNNSKFNTNDNTIQKCLSDTSVHYSSSINKLPNDSTSDGNIVSNKSSTTGNSTSFGDSCERYCAGVKKTSNNTTSDGNNVSVVVQRLRKTDKDKKKLSQRDSGDVNAMLVTVTEQLKSYSTSKSSPLRHIDLRINGKPANDVDTIVSNVNKLDVVSSAEKIEITIPVASKSSGIVNYNADAPNSTINLCIPDRENESKISPIDVGSFNEAKRIKDSTSRSSDSGFMTSKSIVNAKNEKSKKTGSVDCRSRVVPWWTTTESFRRCEIVSLRSTKVTEIVGKVETKMSDVEGKARAIGNPEAVSVERTKEVDVTDAGKTTRLVATEPSSSRQRDDERTRGSIVSTIVASDSRKKSERDERERRLRDQRVNVEKSKTEAKPEAKTDTKVGITALNETSKKELTAASVGSIMSGKSARASTPTLDELSKKVTSPLGSTVSSTEGKSKTTEASKQLRRSGNNSSEGNYFQEKISVKPISLIADRMSNPGKKNGTTDAEEKSKTTKTSKEVDKNVNNNLSKEKYAQGKMCVKPASQIAERMADASKKKATTNAEGKSKTIESSEKLNKNKNSNLFEAVNFQEKIHVKPNAPIANGIMDAGKKDGSAAADKKSKTIESSKIFDKSVKNNSSEANNFQAKIRVKPISQPVKAIINARKKKDTTLTEKNPEPKAPDSKLATKQKTNPRQEVASKTGTNAAPELPRTYGKIKLLLKASYPVKSVNHGNNNRCVIIRPSDRTTETNVKPLKNATIAMRAMDKKTDGTPINRGLTVDTNKKPERKLSGSDSAAPSQTKKITRQKEPVVIATDKEVASRKNKDSLSNSVHSRSTEDTARSILNGPDKNRCKKGEPRTLPSRSESMDSKDATNEPKESANSRTSVKSEEKILKDSNEPKTVENVSSDKKLLYSVWLRRFKERTGQDPDPTKDPSSRNS